MELQSIADFIVFRARRTAYKLLSPKLRYILVVLESLRDLPRSFSEINEYCSLFGFKCRRLADSLNYLAGLDIIENIEGKYYLTDYGEEVTTAFWSIVDSARLIALKVVENRFKEDELFYFASTPAASAIGILSSYEDLYSEIIMAIHGFVSLFVSLVLVYLQDYNPQINKLFLQFISGK